MIPFEIEDDQTVCQALRLIRPHVFTKGGDRVDFTNIPEWQVCQDLGIELVSQVGKPKLWSSSDYLKEWGEFWYKRGNSQHSLPEPAMDKKHSTPLLGMTSERRQKRPIHRRINLRVNESRLLS